jgi:8-oxo-dGTP pyrophosphatase MutT (NUDIX family)
MWTVSESGGDEQRIAFDAYVREIRRLPPDEAFAAASELVKTQAAYRAKAADIRAEQALRIWTSESMTVTELGRRLGGISKQRADKLLERGREVAARQSTVPLPEAIVAAIVTSRRGVLVTKRLDGVPPWGFVTGKIEPGESPADAAVREVKEETGLEVQHGEIIGQRLHPATERLVIYMTARLAKGASTETFNGDLTELTEVRWVNLAEAAELLPDMYEPVRKYLGRVVRGTR